MGCGLGHSAPRRAARSPDCSPFVAHVDASADLFVACNFDVVARCELIQIEGQSNEIQLFPPRLPFVYFSIPIGARRLNPLLLVRCLVMRSR
jgi:hypothetical protein